MKRSIAPLAKVGVIGDAYAATHFLSRCKSKPFGSEQGQGPSKVPYALPLFAVARGVSFGGTLRSKNAAKPSVPFAKCGRSSNTCTEQFAVSSKPPYL